MSVCIGKSIGSREMQLCEKRLRVCPVLNIASASHLQYAHSRAQLSTSAWWHYWENVFQEEKKMPDGEKIRK